MLLLICCVCGLLYQRDTGVGLAYLWQESSWLGQHIYGISSTACFLAAGLFSREFLNLKQYGGWVYQMNFCARVTWMSLLVLMILFSQPKLFVLSDLLGFVTCLGAIISSCYLWFRGDISSKYLTFGWGALISITAVMLASLLGWVDYWSGVLHFQTGGFCIELLFLSIAVAERVSQGRKEKLEAQQKALKMENQAHLSYAREIQLQQQWLQLERQSKDILTLEVERKTQELKLALHSLEQANQELSKRSHTDALTQVANRGYLDERLSHALQVAKREGKSLAVMMLDIDHFKRLNDDYGHQTGDECLRYVAQVLKPFVKKECDLLGRYGGEEFCLFMLGQTFNSALETAESIRQAIQDIRYQDNPSIHITMSIGLCCAVPERETRVEDFISGADRALYRAKFNGRNRIEHNDVIKTKTLDVSPVLV